MDQDYLAIRPDQPGSDRVAGSVPWRQLEEPEIPGGHRLHRNLAPAGVLPTQLRGQRRQQRAVLDTYELTFVEPVTDPEEDAPVLLGLAKTIGKTP